MKITKAEKEKNYQKIIEAAVQVISRDGFKQATMRDIAKAAGVADATIYKYFPTKESILHGYFELVGEKLIEGLQAIPNFHKYTLQEQLHALFETDFQIVANDRGFIRIAYENVFLTNWFAAVEGSKATKERFFEIFDDLIGAAVEVGEIPEPPFKSFLNELLWDYFIGITYYWLKDESENSANTTQVIDKSLNLIVAALKSGILGHAMDLVHFLVREHVLSQLKDPKGRNLDFDKAKRKFMASAEKDA